MGNSIYNNSIIKELNKLHVSSNHKGSSTKLIIPGQRCDLKLALTPVNRCNYKLEPYLASLKDIFLKGGVRYLHGYPF